MNVQLNREPTVGGNLNVLFQVSIVRGGIGNVMLRERHYQELSQRLSKVKVRCEGEIDKPKVCRD